MENKTINRTSLLALLRRIQSSERHLYAPHRKGNQVHFQRTRAVEEITFDYIQTALSAKSVIFPPVEELMRYQREEGGVQITERSPESLPDSVVFGLRPCDAMAVTYMSALFLGEKPDQLFASRLEKTTLVAVSCTRADADCFCTSVGVSPGDTRGSDLLLTPLNDDDYLVEVQTAKGQALIALTPELFAAAAAGTNRQEHLAEIPPEFDLQVLRDKLDKAFDHPFWNETSLRCLGCGACAYVCPVCSCFDIQDEGSRKKGARLRCWDSCGSALFTLHASGHNPRHVQSERWRQRMMHKFSYMPQQLQVPGCVGCGRCLRACPADMNLVEQAQAVIAAV